MGKFIKKPITVEAIQLAFPMSMTTPTGVKKGLIGDYLVNTNDGNQFFVEKTIFELTYQIANEPDNVAPMEVQNVTLVEATDTTADFTYNAPYDADFKHVNVYVDTILVASFVGTGNQTVTVTGLTPSTTHNLLFTAEDVAGNESLGVTTTVTTIATPPTV